jgi:hypothetical protein
MLVVAQISSMLRLVMQKRAKNGTSRGYYKTTYGVTMVVFGSAISQRI